MSVISTRGLRGSRVLLPVLAAIAVNACGKETTPPPPPPPPPPVRTIGVTPMQVSFTDTLGTTPPAAIVVNLTSTGDSSPGALSIGTVTYGPGAADWLTYALSGTEAPATLSIQPDMTTLAAGSYTATIPVLAANASNSPQNITVSFALAPQPPVPPDPPPTDPPPAPIPGITILASGNVARCGTDGRPGDLTAKSWARAQTINPDYFFALGDIVYPPVGATASGNNSLADFQNCYGLTFGQWKAKTYAAVGGREVDSVGTAAGADAYFGPAAIGNPRENYYAVTLGTWRVIVLAVRSGGNSLPVNSRYGAGSAQLAWLTNELNTNTGFQCTMVVWHDPMWLSSSNESSTDPNIGIRRQPQRGIWRLLYDKGVDVVLGGGDHIYERFAPMRYNVGEEDTTPWGVPFVADNARGIVQFSTGLAGDGPTATPHVKFRHPLSVYRSGGVGMLRMTLGTGEYTWMFENSGSNGVPNVQDWGRRSCH